MLGWSSCAMNVYSKAKIVDSRLLLSLFRPFDIRKVSKNGKIRRFISKRVQKLMILVDNLEIELIAV